MFSFLKFIIFAVKLTLNKYSFLRILQIIETKKINLNGTILDLGGNKNPRNISKFFDGNYSIEYADKFPQDDKTIFLDLEKQNILSKKYRFICLMNILEHVKNYRNVLSLCSKSLHDEGLLIGTVPFIFKIHNSPNDYFRFTKQLLNEELEDRDFKEINLIELGYGPFTNFYSSISDYFMQIMPLLNVLLLVPCIFLDKILFIFYKNFSKYYPLGYFFTTKKKIKNS